jgi:hypothetical protein
LADGLIGLANLDVQGRGRRRYKKIEEVETRRTAMRQCTMKAYALNAGMDDGVQAVKTAMIHAVISCRPTQICSRGQFNVFKR